MFSQKDMGSKVICLTAPQFQSQTSEFKGSFPKGVEILGTKNENMSWEDFRRVSVKFSVEKRKGYLSNRRMGLCGVGFGGNYGVEELEPLWDDGYGDQTVNDYVLRTKEMSKPDYGPPRWFCPIECGCPLRDSPLLLYLPGIDGIGMGLVLHHKALGKVFEVRCMHIPVSDRTPYPGLVKFVEETVKQEHAFSPKRPIYLVAESFGGCLALSVAARNPSLDLVLILVNPATSFSRSLVQSFIPFLEDLPKELDISLEHALRFLLGKQIKSTKVSLESCYPFDHDVEKVFSNLTGLLPQRLDDILPRDTIIWRLKSLKSAAADANSRLHAVKAQVLVIASGEDRLIPSRDGALRLSNSIDNCKIRYFKDTGHAFLLEPGVNLLTVIKGTCSYRRTKTRDFVSDFLPPSMSEYKLLFDGILRTLHLATSPVIYSTLADGKIVRGLEGVPEQGPVVLVGHHMLFGFEIGTLIEEFLRQRKTVVHGMSHPAIFSRTIESSNNEFSIFDLFKVFGSMRASGGNFYKLLSNKSYILLYPGGVREALHLKCEKNKLCWPYKPEFVRMAARHGATIVPFGVVGDDDIVELLLDSDDMASIPIFKDIKQQKVRARGLREDDDIVKRITFPPVVFPKIPGRFYFLFGKPIEATDKAECIWNEQMTQQFYSQIQSEIEHCIAYLLEKREKDPYRNIFTRMAYRVACISADHVPSFDP